MEHASFIFTIFFMLLGPIKIIPGFLKLTHEADRSFKRELAIKASLIASAIVAYVAVLGEGLLVKYAISFEALRIAGGLVLLISALNIIFPPREPSKAALSKPTALQLAISPLAVPIIVPPAGVAAILIFTMLTPRYPGMEWVIAQALATVMVLDFLVMLFADTIAKIPGLLLVFQVTGAVLVFIQVALATETILSAFKSLGVFK